MSEQQFNLKIQTQADLSGVQKVERAIEQVQKELQEIQNKAPEAYSKVYDTFKKTLAGVDSLKKGHSETAPKSTESFNKSQSALSADFDAGVIKARQYYAKLLGLKKQYEIDIAKEEKAAATRRQADMDVRRKAINLETRIREEMSRKASPELRTKTSEKLFDVNAAASLGTTNAKTYYSQMLKVYRDYQAELLREQQKTLASEQAAQAQAAKSHVQSLNEQIKYYKQNAEERKRIAAEVKRQEADAYAQHVKSLNTQMQYAKQGGPATVTGVGGTKAPSAAKMPYPDPAVLNKWQQYERVVESELSKVNAATNRHAATLQRNVERLKQLRDNDLIGAKSYYSKVASEYNRYLDKMSQDSQNAEHLLSSIAKRTGTLDILSSAKWALISRSVGAVLNSIQQTLGAVVEFDRVQHTLKGVAGQTDKEIAGLSTLFRQLGSDTEFSAAEVSGLGLELKKAGVPASEIPKMLGNALDLLTSSGADQDAVIKSLVGTLNAFGMKATESTRAVNVMQTTVSESIIDFNDYAEAMKMVAPIAKEAGLNIEETSAYIGKIGDMGLRGTLGGTALKNILQALIDPSKEATGVLSKFNFEGKNLQQTLKMLKEGTSKQEFSTIFNLRALGPSLNLTNEQTMDLFNTLEESLYKQTTTAKSAATEIRKSIGVTWKDIGTEIANVSIGIEQAYTKFKDPSVRTPLEALRDAIRQIGDKLEENPERIRETVEALGSLADAFVEMSPVVLKALKPVVDMLNLAAKNTKTWLELADKVTSMGGKSSTNEALFTKEDPKVRQKLARDILAFLPNNGAYDKNKPETLASREIGPKDGRTRDEVRASQREFFANLEKATQRAANLNNVTFMPRYAGVGKDNPDIGGVNAIVGRSTIADDTRRKGKETAFSSGSVPRPNSTIGAVLGVEGSTIKGGVKDVDAEELLVNLREIAGYGTNYSNPKARTHGAGYSAPMYFNPEKPKEEKEKSPFGDYEMGKKGKKTKQPLPEVPAPELGEHLIETGMKSLVVAMESQIPSAARKIAAQVGTSLTMVYDEKVLSKYDPQGYSADYNRYEQSVNAVSTKGLPKEDAAKVEEKKAESLTKYISESAKAKEELDKALDDSRDKTVGDFRAQVRATVEGYRELVDNGEGGKTLTAIMKNVEALKELTYVLGEADEEGKKLRKTLTDVADESIRAKLEKVKDNFDKRSEDTRGFKGTTISAIRSARQANKEVGEIAALAQTPAQREEAATGQAEVKQTGKESIKETLRNNLEDVALSMSNVGDILNTIYEMQAAKLAELSRARMEAMQNEYNASSAMAGKNVRRRILLEMDYNNRMTKERKKTEAEQLAMAKKQQRIQQVMAVTNSLVAFTSVLMQEPGPSVWKMIAASTTLAAGLVQAAAIGSQKFALGTDRAPTNSGTGYGGSSDMYFAAMSGGEKVIPSYKVAAAGGSGMIEQAVDKLINNSRLTPTGTGGGFTMIVQGNVIGEERYIRGLVSSMDKERRRGNTDY